MGIAKKLKSNFDYIDSSDDSELIDEDDSDSEELEAYYERSKL